MKHPWLAALSACVLVVPFLVSVNAANPGVALIGVGVVPGTALDKSGLAGQTICQSDDNNNCIDQAILGGFGSALTYTGFDNVFVAVPDRGPFDGRTDVPYRDRVNFLHLTVDTTAAFPNIRALLLETRFLKAEGNQDLVGSSAAFGSRFDPEGVAVSGAGTFFVSDEYGPFINEFNRQGHLIRRIAVPGKFSIEHPSGDVDAAGSSLELYPAFNVSGRQASGMTGAPVRVESQTPTVIVMSIRCDAFAHEWTVEGDLPAFMTWLKPDRRRQA